MAPHMCLQSVATGVVARLPLAFAPFTHILGLLGTSRSAMRVLDMLHQLVIVDRLAKVAVLPQTQRLGVVSQSIFIMRGGTRGAAVAVGGDGNGVLVVYWLD